MYALCCRHFAFFCGVTCKLTLGLKLEESYNVWSSLSLQDFRYYAHCSTVTEELPNKDSIDDIYSLIEELKDYGIDVFGINIDTPNFLLPKMESGHGARGVRLAGIGFETDIGITSFEEQYYRFVDQIYWDKQQFDNKISEFTQRGYKNAYFYVSKWADENTLEIVLYCESDASLSNEYAATLLEGIDDSYFRIDGKKTKYTLQHIFT